jgi:hypothetical protein
MPIWLRKFHIHKVSEWNKKRNEEMKKAQKGNSQPLGKAMGPNISPSSTYNFKK